jgi:hypothetical protein
MSGTPEGKSPTVLVRLAQCGGTTNPTTADRGPSLVWLAAARVLEIRSQFANQSPPFPVLVPLARRPISQGDVDQNIHLLLQQPGYLPSNGSDFGRTAQPSMFS